MAASNSNFCFKVTAHKILSPTQKTLLNPLDPAYAAQTLVIMLQGTSAIFNSVPSPVVGATDTDTMCVTSDGYTIIFSQALATFATNIAAVDCTGS